MKELVTKHGAQNWSVIAKALPGRNGKSCRWVCRTGVMMGTIHAHESGTLSRWGVAICAKVTCILQPR